MPFGPTGPPPRVLREALLGYRKAGPAVWQRFNAESLLGRQRHSEAAPFLISGYAGLIRTKATIDAQNLQYLEKARKGYGRVGR